MTRHDKEVKKTMTDFGTVIVTRVTPETKAAFTKYAASLGMSKSEVLRRYVEKIINRRK